MCGIVGVLAEGEVNQTIYDALTILQHRGQDAAGIMTSDARRVYLRKSNGLVRDVVLKRHMLRLKGRMGIGHVRYPTAGSESASESQPFYVNSPYGLSIVHNGNLVNTQSIAKGLTSHDLRHLNTTSDSELLLNVFASELQAVGGPNLGVASLFEAVERVCQRIQGAYSVIVMIQGYGLLAFRDPNGIRPLVYGVRKNGPHSECMVASESIALDANGFTLVQDIAPGQAVFIGLDGEVHRRQCVSNSALNPCLFEYIYLARPDSVIDTIPVYSARLAMGRFLAQQIADSYPDHDIDVVIPVPDTSRTAAFSLAKHLGVDYSEGFVKNRYIGRTFIMPGQQVRRDSVRLKLSAVRQEFHGKNVLLVDDSIVRGTTSKNIVTMAREVGAKKVYFASAAPKVCFPNVYGIDMPDANELIAHGRSTDDIAAHIGVDWLLFQRLSDVERAVNDARPAGELPITRFEDSIFTGEYIAGQVDGSYLQYIASLRSDQAKHKRQIEVDDEQDCGVSIEE